MLISFVLCFSLHKECTSRATSRYKPSFLNYTNNVNEVKYYTILFLLCILLRCTSCDQRRFYVAEVIHFDLSNNCLIHFGVQ